LAKSYYYRSMRNPMYAEEGGGSAKKWYVTSSMVPSLFLFSEGRSLQVSSASSEQDLEVLNFDRRRAWNLKVQQIPCGCTGERMP